MKILKRIGSILLDVLIVIVFIVSILVVASTVTSKTAGGQSNIFGYTINSVQTDSMKDAIDQGDLVISKLITEENREEIDLKEEDIVSYYDAYEKKLITHRIIEVRGEGNTRTYTTKGDNAPAPDVPITINDIESVYVFKIPFLGSFIDFLKTPFGFIICLVIPLLAFIAFQAYKLVTLYLKSKKLELEEAAAANVAAKAADAAKDSKPELSEEEKNAIIAEYLAKQAAEAAKADGKDENTEEKDDSAAEDAKGEEKSEDESQTEEKSADNNGGEN